MESVGSLEGHLILINSASVTVSVFGSDIENKSLESGSRVRIIRATRPWRIRTTAINCDLDSSNVGRFSNGIYFLRGFSLWTFAVPPRPVS